MQFGNFQLLIKAKNDAMQFGVAHFQLLIKKKKNDAM